MRSFWPKFSRINTKNYKNRKKGTSKVTATNIVDTLVLSLFLLPFVLSHYCDCTLKKHGRDILQGLLVPRKS